MNCTHAIRSIRSPRKEMRVQRRATREVACAKAVTRIHPILLHCACAAEYTIYVCLRIKLRQAQQQHMGFVHKLEDNERTCRLLPGLAGFAEQV